MGIFFNQTWGWGRKSGLILICWSFASLILSDIYSEEIYSSLAAPTRPNVPDTLVTLEESNLSILTISSFRYAGRMGTWRSLLNDIVIPELLESHGRNLKVTDLVAKISRKLVFVNGTGSQRDHRFWSKYSYIKELTGQEEFAVLDVPVQLEFVAKYGVDGNQVVVRNSEETPFRTITFGSGLRNFFSPKIQETLATLTESGISGQWKSLEVEKADIAEMWVART